MIRQVFRTVLVLVFVSAFSSAALAQPTFSKSFAPSTMGPGSTSSLVFLINNDGGGPVSDLAFTDNLPAGVTIADGFATTDCGGSPEPTLVAVPGTAIITFSDGRLAGNQVCRVFVPVTAPTAGTYMNVSGDLTSSAGNSGSASADLTVNNARLGVIKTFVPDSIPVDGISRLTLDIDGSLIGGNTFNIAVTDDLPDGLEIAFPANLVTDCVGTINATAGTSQIQHFQGFLTANQSCSIAVDVVATGDVIGTLENRTTDLSSSAGSNGFAIDTIDVFFPFLRKKFSNPIGAGGTGTLEFTIQNLDRNNSATNINFTDDLDATLTGLIATSVPLVDPCGAGSMLSGASLLALTGGNLPPGGSCTFSVDVSVPMGATPGTYPNTTNSPEATIGGSIETFDPATNVLVVQNAPTLTKTFLDTVITGGDTVDVEFTIQNTDPANGITDIAFTDNLGLFLSGVTVSALPAPNFCGSGSIAFTFFDNGNLTLQIQGANLGAGASCTFQVTLQTQVGTPTGTYTNTTSAISGTISGGTVNGATATDDLSVVGAPAFAKVFDPTTVAPGGTANLEFTITNSIEAPGAATNIGFTDNLGAVLTGLASTSGTLNDICGVGSSISGTNVLTFTGGTLGVGESCTFSVTVQVPVATTPGTYTNTAGPLSAMVLGETVTGSSPTADILVTDFAFTKQFIPSSTVAGQTVALEFTLTNNSATESATNILFTDTLSTTLSGLVSSSGTLNDVCGPGSSISGTNFLIFVNGSLGPTESCTFAVNVDVPAGAAVGLYPNTTSNLSATIGGSSVALPPATAPLEIIDPLSFTKSFTDDPVEPGASVTLEFVITNSGNTPLTAITFTDDLDAALTGLVSTSGTVNDVCGLGSSISGTNLLTLTGGNLAAMSSCTFQVTLLVPGSAALGAVATNTTSVISGDASGVAVSGLPATDELEINFVRLTKSFSGPSTPSGQVMLSFTLENLSTTTTASALAFNDDLSAVIAGLVSSSGTQSNVCGVGSQITGTSLLAFTNGTLDPSSSCTFDVTLDVPVSAVAGTFPNTTSTVTSSGLEIAGAATADLTIEPPPTFAKLFNPDAIGAGLPSVLTFTIDNSASTLAASSLDFTDNLPAGVVVAMPPNASTDCSGGTITAVAGMGTISYTGGSVAAGSTCIVQVTVTTTMAGTFDNTSGDLTSSSGNSGTASDTLVAVPQPSFAKAFGTDPVITGDTVTLTFTIDNTASILAATSLTFVDNLPTGLVVATPANTVNNCGGTLTATSGSSAITLSGGTVAATSSCTISVDVLANGAATGLLTNMTMDLTSSLGNSGMATDTITVNPPPVFAKSFATDPIIIGGVSTLTFDIDNTASTVNATALAFTDNLPTGLIVATPANTANTCGGTLTATDGSGVITLTGGTATAGASCSISVDIEADGNATGTLDNISGALTSNLGNSGMATDNITVNAPPTFTKAFGTDPTIFGAVISLGFTIDNSTSTVDATALDFTDPLPTGLVVATPANAVNTCTGGTLTATDGSGTISYTGGTVSASASCTITVDILVDGTMSGLLTNTTTDLTSSLGSSSMATDDVTVNPPPGFTKAFGADPIIVGGISTLTFTLDNASSTVDATAVVFTDNLPMGIEVAVVPNATNTCTGGTLTATSGSNSISYTGGTIDAGTTCTISVDTVGNGSAFGLLTNTSDDLTSSLGNSGMASDTIVVNPPPTFTKAFGTDPVTIGTTSTLTFTIDNTASTISASGIGFIDNLPTGLVVATPPNSSNTCGGTLTAVAGASSIDLTAGTLATGATCTITVDVLADGAATGVLTNTTTDLNSTLGTSAPAVATVTTEFLPLTLAKLFTEDVIQTGETSTVTLTIDNPNIVAVGTLAITDTLPTDVVVATPANAGTTCTGGTVTATAGSGTASYTGGTVAASSSCTVTFDVTSTVAGTYTNTTGDLTSDAGTTSGASDDLTVIEPIVTTKAFLSDPVVQGGIVELQFTIDNTSTTTLTDIAFTDDLDAVVTGLVAVSGAQNNVCGAGSLLDGTTVLSLTGGTLAPMTSCTFTAILEVPADAPLGTYDNQTSAVTYDANGVMLTGPATPVASFTVVFLDFAKVFDVDFAVAGEIIGLTFMIDNPDPINSVEGIAFDDNLDAVIPGMVAVGLPEADVCGLGSQVDGTSVISLTGGTLAGGASCTFTVLVQIPPDAPTATQFTNLTDPLSAVVNSNAISGDGITVAEASIAIAANPLEIPTLGEWGLIVLAALLGLVAVRRMRMS
ncbi:MAG: IPTL-CTERM sorting domain-containing protein [Acidobacteriota bacterium]